MTSIPQVPGASALYLYREENTSELDHATTFYVRIKILKESAKDLADVEMPFGGQSGISFDNFAGRTIHGDGTIVTFTGKPYEKLVEKEKGYKYKVKVATLPAVEVGSIIEYRYRRKSNYAVTPDWFIQSGLYTRRAHFLWRRSTAGVVAFTPLLPAGVEVTRNKDSSEFVLDVQDVPPQPHDTMMPPLDSLSYRVLFYYTQVRSMDEFWKTTGTGWATAVDNFMTPGRAVVAAVAQLTAPGDKDEQKLHKIYAELMSFENTDFTRRLTDREAKAKGFKNIKSTDDIWLQRRGSGNQIAALFVSMARAAGLKAYLMVVADRSQRLFLPAYLNFDQLDDYVAVVKVNGADMGFDPGQRYMPFAHLAWFHCQAGGLRETDTGAELAETPPGVYSDNHISRIADLAVDEQGAASGTITLTFAGDPARRWRQAALLDDETGLKTRLRAALEEMLPAGMEVEVSSTGSLTDFDKPLAVVYSVHGPLGSSTGKRLVLPASLFEARTQPLFPNERRDVPVDMRLGSSVQDAVRYRLPATLTVESYPSANKIDLSGKAAFKTSWTTSGNSTTLYRNLSVGTVFFSREQYPELRGFFQKLEARDQESLVLTRAAAAAKGAD